MENQELYKQAILDAKAVRETAMAAARTTLAEHFEPYIKETMEKTLKQEEIEETSEMEMEEAEDPTMEGMSYMDESALDEILAELDALEEASDDQIEEGKGQGMTAGYSEKAHVSKGETGYDHKAGKSSGDHKLHEADDEDGDDEEKDDDDEKDSAPKAAKAPGAEKGPAADVVDLTVAEFEDIIRSAISQYLPGAGEEMGEPLDADTEMAADMGMGGDEEGGMPAGDDADLSLDEILAELEAEEKKMEEAASTPGSIQNAGAYEVSQVEEMKKELNEAVKTIKALKAELNETNLFSAKMLYVNKIFKSKNLTESQKRKVIDAFDRNTSIKEVENTYKTLLESLASDSKKGSLKESVGFASKSIGGAPARPIVEADAFVSRWQQLAGIKK